MNNQKPIIFFSHSNKDSSSLSQLKDALLEKTSDTIEIFLSSDGQSIPLGRNWVYKIEEALKVCKVIFVFLSPSSLQSGWVYFESGIAYSRGIRVVPVAILGVDLNQLKPPLGLLQGFNITSHDRLNNIVSILNEEFGSSYPLSFTVQEYKEIFPSSEKVESSIKEYSQAIHVIDLKIKAEKDERELIVSFLRDRRIEYQKSHNGFEIFGASIRLHKQSDLTVLVDFRIDPLLTNITFPVISEIVRTVLDYDKDYSLIIYMEPWVRHAPTYYAKQNTTAKLHDSGVKMLENGSFQLGEMVFELRSQHYGKAESSNYQAVLHVTSSLRNLEDVRLYELLDLLFARKVLSLNDGMRSLLSPSYDSFA